MLQTTAPIIQNANSLVTLIDDNIFYVRYKRDLLIEISDFEETRNAYHELRTNGPLKFLVEFTEFVSVTPDARRWAEIYQVDTTAEAIVFKSLAQRIIIRFYVAFRRQSHPVRIFTCKEKATAWLNSL